MHRILNHKCCSPDPKMNSENEILNFFKFAPFLYAQNKMFDYSKHLCVEISLLVPCRALKLFHQFCACKTNGQLISEDFFLSLDTPKDQRIFHKFLPEPLKVKYPLITFIIFIKYFQFFQSLGQKFVNNFVGFFFGVSEDKKTFV